jgi:hypothetical protein
LFSKFSWRKATPTLATSNSFLNSGKKIYKTKPALPNNPSHLLALLHEHRFSQRNRHGVVLGVLKRPSWHGALLTKHDTAAQALAKTGTCMAQAGVFTLDSIIDTGISQWDYSSVWGSLLYSPSLPFTNE